MLHWRNAKSPIGTKLKVLSKNKTVILISAYHDVAQNHEKQKKIGGLYRLVDIKS